MPSELLLADDFFFAVSRDPAGGLLMVREVQGVANSDWLIVHDGAPGRARLGRRVLDVGLAAALLGELLALDLVAVEDGMACQRRR
jgi:hypothetical protein